MSGAQKIFKGVKHFLLANKFLESKNILESKRLLVEIFYGGKKFFWVKFFCGEGPKILG